MQPKEQPGLYHEVEHNGYHSNEAYELARHDMNYFAALALPMVTEFAFPPLYLVIWGLLIELSLRVRDFSKVAIGFPRGFAKTSVIKLFILYLIIFTNKTHIAIICSTATHAQNIISDVADMLDSDNIKNLFGDWRVALTKDTQEQKWFGYKGRNVILTAIGQGGSVRGLNIKNQRPDVMVFDDIQTREDADSDLVSDKIMQWMVGTAMKAASHRGCLYIFLGNMYPTKHSILKKLKVSTEWIKFIVGGILIDGTSLWEQLKPLKQLIAEYLHDKNLGHEEIFKAEVLNDEHALVSNTLDITKIPAYPYDDFEISAGSFIIIDPSNDKANSDKVSIGAFDIIAANPCIVEIDEGSYSATRTIEQAIDMACRRGISLIIVEANGYQYSLLERFTTYCEEIGLVGIEFLPIYSGKRSKNSRILDMFKALTDGTLLIHPNCYAQVINQASQFNALSTKNVDGILDLLSYAQRVQTEYGSYITINNPVPMNTVSTPKVLSIEYNSEF